MSLSHPSTNIFAELEALAKEVSVAIASAQTEAALVDVKVHVLGKKGKLTSILKQLGTLSPDLRGRAGEDANRLKDQAMAEIEARLSQFKSAALEAVLAKDRLDVTLPGKAAPLGHLHPIQKILDEIVDLFSTMAFAVEEGPEIETEYYNFEALNMPESHPARDMQDTFYLDGGTLLRTHTSPVQIHYMHAHQPPFQMIAPGKVYRRDSDVSHLPMFHQVEGLVVGEAISMAHLKGTLSFFLNAFFGEDLPVRLRPSYFPFTEPSCEVDIGCMLCKSAGCPVCKQTGWLEVMGAGMVHPTVFTAVGYDPKKITGFAFGMGVERLAMLKYRIPDIRLFYENNPKFLEQF